MTPFTFRPLVLALTCAASMAYGQAASNWITDFEASGGMRTPRYDATVAYCRRLAQASPWVHYGTFGISPQGRELPLVIVSKDAAFTPAAAARTGKAVLLIQSCIHAGEPDGKDASLMLIRDIAVTKKLLHLLDHAILLFVPIFNVDGHERFSRYNRINQNGPEEMGWRVTAQDLNLNRDYMKADTPEMQAMLKLFAAWLPDMYIDCHVTDGMDFQYDVTYAVEYAQNVEPPIARWLKQTLLPGMLPRVEAAGHRIFFYVFPREENDLSKGLNGGAASPRFSTGYAAIQNRPALLIETHMLKPYKTRVEATYAVLSGIIETVDGSPAGLKQAVRAADEATIRAGKDYDPRRSLPLRLAIDEKPEMRTFLGVRSHTEPSDISGGQRTVYTGEPVTLNVPFFEDVTVQDSATIPLAYIVSPEWSVAREALAAHSIRYQVLKHDASITVESYRFADVRFRPRPYEGRQTATYTTTMIRERRVFPAGSVVVPMDQRAAKVAMHLLEPGSPDALVAWGSFNAIFEQKEYAEAYVMERVGAEMLAKDPELKAEFQEKIRTDTSFARSPDSRLNWLYNHSAWADPLMNKYPVGRIVEEAEMRQVEREK